MRKAIAVVFGALVLSAGLVTGLVAGTVAEPTVTTQTFTFTNTGEATYTIPTETETETQTETITDTITVTVTETQPPPPPPPPPDPPPMLDCTTDNYWNDVENKQAWTWEQCFSGTTLVLENTEWHCNRPLVEYATNGLPLKVISRWSSGSHAEIAVSTDNGCVGVEGNDINLIVNVDNLGGATITDVYKTRGSPGPQYIRMTGNLEGGERNPLDHQDCIQLQGGGKTGPNYLVNVNCPDYETGEAQVQGAGGALFTSLNLPQINVFGGSYIACNHSLSVSQTGGQIELAPGSNVVNARFRSGNLTTAFCQGFNSSPACTGVPEPGETHLQFLNRVFDRFENVVCQRYVNGQWVDQ